ncbi:hypothetical protein EDD16DRAFT_1523171 [Pisolithus croceorrhizus]|nr:hypothetical protein EV401DRAFT_1894059 [Pisolithus croceorrhizus]KAI6107572.1 hypothetical protein EDD16DRAFT_1523171 [Pisolithus croceorrhizus]
MALPLKLSNVEVQNAKDIESICLELGGHKHPITRTREKSDTFSKVFHPPLTLDSALSFSTSRKKSLFTRFRRADPETVTIRPDDVLPNLLDGLEYWRVWGHVSIKLVFLPHTQPGVTIPSAGTPVPAKLGDLQPAIEQPIVNQSTSTHDAVPSANTTVPDNIPAPANRERLRPTTEDLIKQCPRFRVLVIGKSVATDRPGEADIDKEYTSPQNDRLILHDSKGFEPADGGNYDTVKSFIQKRKRETDIKDQLHAVWLCFQIPIPTYGERLLEDGAETFFKMRKDVLGNTPTIVVFTKHDRLMTFMRQKRRGDPEAGQRYLQEYCIQPILDFTGDKTIAHVAVSSQTLPAKPKYEQSLEGLIRLTQEMVSSSFTSPGNQVSPVPLAAAGAQRMLPTLKVDLSIDVGKQRYWRALGSSANFRGHTIQDCLGVIHTDIVTVWNFYDPCEVSVGASGSGPYCDVLTPLQYLNSEELRKMMMHMVERVDAAAESNPLVPRSETLAGGLANHTSDSGMRAKKLTRTAIKLAYKAYYQSEWMRNSHTDIRFFQCSSTARDEVLQKITSMIPSSDRETRVSGALEGVESGDLERDEEWLDNVVSL